MDTSGKRSPCWRALGTLGFLTLQGRHSGRRGAGLTVPFPERWAIWAMGFPSVLGGVSPSALSSEGGCWPCHREGKALRVLPVGCWQDPQGRAVSQHHPPHGRARGHAGVTAVDQRTVGTAHGTAPSPKDLTTEQRSCTGTRLYHQQISHPEAKPQPLWLLTQLPRVTLASQRAPPC